MIRFRDKRVPVSLPESKSIVLEKPKGGLTRIQNLIRLLPLRVVLPNQYFEVGTTVYVPGEFTKMEHKVYSFGEGAAEIQYTIVDESQLLAVEEVEKPASVEEILKEIRRTVVTLPASGLTQEIVQDEMANIEMELYDFKRVSTKVFVSPETRRKYNKLSFGWQRIVLSGANALAKPANLDTQYTVAGLAEIIADVSIPDDQAIFVTKGVLRDISLFLGGSPQYQKFDMITGNPLPDLGDKG